jgi:hypothetical protein
MSADGSRRHSVGPAAAWKLIGSRNFGPYFVGNALSSSGTWFQNLAGSILVYRLTHSPFLLGILNAAQFGPVLLLAPWTLESQGGGALRRPQRARREIAEEAGADRWSRRTIRLVRRLS